MKDDCLRIGNLTITRLKDHGPGAFPLARDFSFVQDGGGMWIPRGAQQLRITFSADNPVRYIIVGNVFNEPWKPKN